MNGNFPQFDSSFQYLDSIFFMVSELSKWFNLQLFLISDSVTIHSFIKTIPPFRFFPWSPYARLFLQYILEFFLIMRQNPTRSHNTIKHDESTKQRRKSITCQSRSSGYHRFKPSSIPYSLWYTVIISCVCSINKIRQLLHMEQRNAHCITCQEQARVHQWNLQKRRPRSFITSSMGPI